MSGVLRIALNALLAGFWAGIGALQVSGELTKAAVIAAAAVAVRAAVGYLAAYFDHPVPVDTA